MWKLVSGTMGSFTHCQNQRIGPVPRSKARCLFGGTAQAVAHTTAMPEEFPIPPAVSGLVIRQSTGLASLREGDSSALSEIISRSLTHIQANRALALPVRRPGEEQEFEIAPGVKIVMCWIPPGDFLKGDDLFAPPYRVTLKRGFWLGKYQVTQAQWQAVMGSNPSYYEGADLPVESVSWEDISRRGGFLDRVNSFSKTKGIFSLPTESQWEFASLEGNTAALKNKKFLHISNIEACPYLSDIAWNCENSGRTTHPVGQKKANDWGLHDMQGNVEEWCVDLYVSNAEEPQVTRHEMGSGLPRVIRGGSWRGKWHSTASPRGGYNSTYAVSYIGFRIARNCPMCDDVEACVRDDGKLHPLPELSPELAARIIW